jgi:hypothetical protein
VARIRVGHLETSNTGGTDVNVMEHNWNENRMVALTTYGWWRSRHTDGGRSVDVAQGYVRYIRREGWDMWIDVMHGIIVVLDIA